MALGGRTPQVLVTLAPDGSLQAELPGANGARRRVPLRDGELALTLHRMLDAQSRERYAIGEDGAPTQQQLKHWEAHQIWPDDRCPFCKAEGRLVSKAGMRRQASVMIVEHGSAAGAVKIRRIIKPKRATHKRAEDLGL